MIRMVEEDKTKESATQVSEQYASKQEVAAEKTEKNRKVKEVVETLKNPRNPSTEKARPDQPKKGKEESDALKDSSEKKKALSQTSKTSSQKTSDNQNPNREIFVEKLTLSMGTGTDMELLKKGMKLLKIISGSQPVKSLAKKRIPAWSIRPGLPIGCKVTLRGKKAEEKLRGVLKAVDDKLSPKNFDQQGNFSFGIKEYIDLPNMDYNYDLGILGFQVSVTLARPGYRVKERKYSQRDIGKSHVISKEEGIEFVKKKFNVVIE